MGAQSQMLTLAHDYFTQRGGAERVAAALAERLSPSQVITALYEPGQTFFIDDSVIKTSPLQRFPFFRRDNRRALPLLALTWALFAPVSEGVLICSTSGWSHMLRTRRSVQKIVYCHNPARWLYQTDDYSIGLGTAVNALLVSLRPALRFIDQRAARSANKYFANSTAVAKRVQSVYGIEAEVLHPPVLIDANGAQEELPLMPGFFLSVGRGRGYKNAERLVQASVRVPNATFVFVGLEPSPDLPPNCIALGGVSEEKLRFLYATCKAVISVSFEDFGLTPLEGNSFGKPCLVLRAGGFLDSVVDGVSGSFIEAPSEDRIADAVNSFSDNWDEEVIKRHAARFSLASFTSRLLESAGLESVI